MNHALALNARGLVTSPNPLTVPSDALGVADNIILNRTGLIQSRLGLTKAATGPGGPINSIFTFNGNVYAHYGASLGSPTILKYWNGSVWSTALSGTFTGTRAARMHTVEASGNLYLTAGDVYRMEHDGATILGAGAPKALGLDRYGPTNVLTGTGGFLTDGYWCAYRAVIGYKLGTAPTVLGAPSSRTVITNVTGTSGYAGGVAKNVVARILLPKAVNTASTALTTSYFVQLYRSAITTSGAASDEMQLVAEQYLGASDISNGYVEITDICPEAFRGAYLYTNASAGDPGLRPGLANSNEPPPAARSIAQWRDCMWYGRTTSRYRLAVQILGTGTTGLAATHTITVAGTTYTAIAPGAPAANQFVVETSGSASQNIESTAINLVSCINKSASNTLVYAYYVSGSAPDSPGKIVFESRLQSSAASFTVAASANGTAYLPNIGAAASATRDVLTNGVSFSKPDQPEAVPLLNNFAIGSTANTVLASDATQDALWIWTSQGLYRAIGTDYTNFQVELFDSTAILAGPQMHTVLDGEVFAMTTQGACRVSMSGLQYVSGDIDADLRSALTRCGLSTQSAFGFVVANVQDHRVEFWLSEDPSATSGCKYAYCYDPRGKSWTRRYFSATAGTTSAELRMGATYDPDSGLVWMCGGVTGDGEVYYELRTGSASDYTDTLSDASAVAPYRVVAWSEQDGDDPAQAKAWREAQVMWGDAVPVTVTCTVESSEGATESSTFTPTAGSTNRIPVGRISGRGTRLYLEISNNDRGAGFDIAGVSLFCRSYGPRSVK